MKRSESSERPPNFVSAYRARLEGYEGLPDHVASDVHESSRDGFWLV